MNKKLLLSLSLIGFTGVSCSKVDESQSSTKRVESPADILQLFNATEETKNLRLDVNDVAVLWPSYHYEPTGLNYVQMIDYQNVDNDLIPSREDFTKIVDFAKGEDNFNAGTGIQLENPFTDSFEWIQGQTDSLFLGDWISGADIDVPISSFRVEDCGVGLHKGNEKTDFNVWIGNKETGDVNLVPAKDQNCMYMLRLIAAPFSDAAMHIIYTFHDKRIFDNMVSDLQYLKSISPENTTGKPLGIHPGFTNKEKGAEFSKSVSAFVNHYANHKYLTNISFLTTNEFDGSTEWIFFGAKFHHNENYEYTGFTMRPLHALKDNAISQPFSFKGDVRMVRDNLPKVAGPEMKTSAEAFKKIIDPSVTFSTSQDCKGCHSVAKELVENDGAERYDYKEIFNDASSVFYNNGVTGFPDSKLLPTEPENFRAFGWFLDRATVNMRVAIKAGATAGAINKRLFNDSSANGAKCENKEHLVMQCILKNAGQESSCIEDICE